MPKCATCGIELRQIPAGVTKDGRQYEAFFPKICYNCKKAGKVAPVNKNAEAVKELDQFLELNAKLDTIIGLLTASSITKNRTTYKQGEGYVPVIEE